MAKIDLRYYWAVFLRRLPYFLVITSLITVLAATIAYVLPPVYRSSARLLVEPQQIPGELARTTVPINPFEQAQIIEQRLMTRANLLELADRVGLYDDEPDMSAGARAGDIYQRIEFIGFTPDVTRAPNTPGATIIGVAFEAPTAEFANKGANELVNLVLEENVKLRTARASDTMEFFRSQVDQLEKSLEAQSAKITQFKTENFEALPDSLATRRAQQQREQERLLALEREESGLINQRDTIKWVYERTGRTTGIGQTPEAQTLQQLQTELAQKLTVYAPGSPQIRLLKSRIAAMQALVDGQDQGSGEGPVGPDGNLLSSLDVELAPIEARLGFIAEERALIEQTLSELDTSIQDTPANEMVLQGLEREYASLNEQYEKAVASLGQAQVGERIEVLSKGERFSLIEPPRTPRQPVRPKRALITAAGVVGGIGAGLGFILLMEMLNRSIRRPVEIVSQLGIQPFATIPYIRSPGETRRKRALVFAVIALIVVGIPAGLFAIHTYYLPLDLLLGQALETGAETAQDS